MRRLYSLRNKVAWVFGSGLVLTGLLVACDSSETAAGPVGPAYPSEESFCQDLGVALCNVNVVEACYLSSSTSIDGDTESCMRSVAKIENCNPERYPYHYEGAEACIASMEQIYQDAALSQAELSAADEACLVAFSLGGVEGSPCDASVDCNAAAGLRCVAKPGQEGSCQIPEEVAPGTSCAADTAVCTAEFYCGSNLACIEKPGQGSPCSDAEPCAEDALCEGDMCAAKLANTEECTQNEECAGGFCVKAQGQDNGVCGSQLNLSPTTQDSCTRFITN